MVLVDIGRSMRPQQWLKNTFCLAPLLFAEVFFDPGHIFLALACFGAFSLAASAGYLFNDLLDIERDRAHPRKRERPLPAGRISPGVAITAAVVAAGLALSSSFAVRPSFGLTLLAYLILTLAYTLWLKHVVLVDIFVIALGFVLRVLAGAYAISVPISQWILICTIFLALFLGACKRRGELTTIGDSNSSTRRTLREYNTAFLDQIITALAAMAILAYALYAKDHSTVARFGPNLILSLPFVIYGIFRYLFLVTRRELGESPTKLLVSDRPIVFAALLWVATVTMIIGCHRMGR